MNNINIFLISLMLFAMLNFNVSAAPAGDNSKGYISDELYVFMHSGAGKQYRITGTIVAGSQVQLTGEKANGFSEFIDDKGKSAWVEDEFIANKPGIRFAIAELNTQLANQTERTRQLSAELSESQQQLSVLTEKNQQQTRQVENLTKTLASANQTLSEQDNDVKKQWFYNGAVVLGIGLLLGLVLPKLFVRRRSSMSSWK